MKHFRCHLILFMFYGHMYVCMRKSYWISARLCTFFHVSYMFFAAAISIRLVALCCWKMLFLIYLVPFLFGQFFFFINISDFFCSCCCRCRCRCCCIKKPLFVLFITDQNAVCCTRCVYDWVCCAVVFVCVFLSFFLLIFVIILKYMIYFLHRRALHFARSLDGDGKRFGAIVWVAFIYCLCNFALLVCSFLALCRV